MSQRILNTWQKRKVCSKNAAMVRFDREYAIEEMKPIHKTCKSMRSVGIIAKKNKTKHEWRELLYFWVTLNFHQIKALANENNLIRLPTKRVRTIGINWFSFEVKICVALNAKYIFSQAYIFAVSVMYEILCNAAVALNIWNLFACASNINTDAAICLHAAKICERKRESLQRNGTN